MIYKISNVIEECIRKSLFKAMKEPEFFWGVSLILNLDFLYARSEPRN